MSESGSSFEKIEFEQSALSAPSTGESSDLTLSDQNSIDESWATTMSGSTEDQTKSVQLEDLEFELGWKTRDNIMCTLSRHTTLLSGLIIKEDAREKVCKANADLIVVLLNLPLKVDGRPRSIESSECSPNDAPNELLLDLSSEVRSRIVDTLMINHNLALLEADRVSSECKTKLIERNNELICEMVRLKSRIVSKDDHRIEKAAKASEPQTTSKVADEKLGELNNSKRSDRNADASLPLQKAVGQSTTDQDALLEKLRVQIADQLRVQIADQLGKPISVLEESVRCLKKELAESKRLDVCRNETTFTFELKGVNALLAGDSTKQRASEFFYLRSIPWFLIVSPHRSSGANYLAIYLICNNVFDQDTWNVMTTFEVRLLSTNTVCTDMVATPKNQAFKSSDPLPSWGWPRFISTERLRAGSFVQNDTIKIQVHLTVKSFERIGHFVEV